MITFKNLFFLFSVLSLSSTLFPRASFSHIAVSIDQDVMIPPYSFRRYVVPSLRALLLEYYTLVEKHSSPLERTRIFRKKLQALDLHARSLETSCPNQQPSCAELFSILKEDVQGILTTLETYSKSDDKKKEKPLPSQREAIRLCTSSLARLKYLIEKDPEAIKWQQVAHQLEQVRSQLPFLLFLDLPKALGQSFEQLFTSFVRPLELYVLSQKKKEVLEQGIERFNQNWNFFHLALKSLPVKKEGRRMINLMHNRWNGVLKTLSIKKAL